MRAERLAEGGEACCLLLDWQRGHVSRFNRRHTCDDVIPGRQRLCVADCSKLGRPHDGNHLSIASILGDQRQGSERGLLIEATRHELVLPRHRLDDRICVWSPKFIRAREHAGSRSFQRSQSLQALLPRPFESHCAANFHQMPSASGPSGTSSCCLLGMLCSARRSLEFRGGAHEVVPAAARLRQSDKPDSTAASLAVLDHGIHLRSNEQVMPEFADQKPEQCSVSSDHG